MGLLSIFKSSDKAIDAAAGVVTGAVSGIDKLFFTDEEKSDARGKYFATWLELQKTISNESTPTALARRVLAFMIMGVFLFFIFFGVVMWKFDREWAKVIFEDGVGRLEFLAGAVGATYFIKDALVKTFRAKG